MHSGQHIMISCSTLHVLYIDVAVLAHILMCVSLFSRSGYGFRIWGERFKVERLVFMSNVYPGLDKNQKWEQKWSTLRLAA